MSERWQGFTDDDCPQRPQDLTRSELDMAARYASQLRELHENCQNDPKFYIKILGYSEITASQGKYILNPTSGNSSAHLPRTSWTQIPPTPSRPSTRPPALMNSYGYSENSTFYQQRMLNSPNGPSTYNPSLADSTSASTSQSRLYRPQQLNTPSPFTSISLNSIDDNSNGSGVSDDLMGMSGSGEIVQDELSVMSQVLLGQPFLELDRVITLEGTDFEFNANNWATLS